MPDGQSRTIALPAVVDLDALDDVRDRLLDAVESGPVVIDGGNVERVATNALLMLISAADTARRNRFELLLEPVSAPLLSAIQRLGLTASFARMTKG